MSPSVFHMMFYRPPILDSRFPAAMRAANELAWKQYHRTILRLFLLEMAVCGVGMVAIAALLWWLTA